MWRWRLLAAVPPAVASVTPLAATSAAGASNAGRAAGSAQARSTGALRSDSVAAAEQLIGLRFTDAEENMALAGAARNLASFEALRRLDVPLDTEPATTFR